MSADSDTVAPDVSDSSRAPVATQRKPRLALFIATACGLGYIPVAPGTFGSLAGLAMALLPWWSFFTIAAVIIAEHNNTSFFVSVNGRHADPFLWAQVALAVFTAVLGVWSASRAAHYWQQGDPQRVVIDEVSGQHLTLLLGCAIPLWWKPFQFPAEGETLGYISIRSPLNWKYLLLGFILFRVFDIWKPFPARQAESLTGGWGIMADDWIAGIYAAIGLWLARAAGL
jgi:phosphatidylglycerophosphatase A